MSLTVTIKAMLASGCTAEQLANVVEAHEKAQLEIQKEKRAKRAAQKRVERERRLMSSNVAATSSDNVRHDATTCDISSPSSPSPNGFPPAYIVPDNTPLSLTPTSTPSPRANKGQRLPDDWHPRAEDGLDNLELAKFRDYWKAVPGQKGTKLDWDATWRNWLRTAGKSPTNAKPSVEVRTGPRNVFKPEPETPQLTEEEKARRREQVDAVLKGLWRPASGQE